MCIISCLDSGSAQSGTAGGAVPTLRFVEDAVKHQLCLSEEKSPVPEEDAMINKSDQGSECKADVHHYVI